MVRAAPTLNQLQKTAWVTVIVGALLAVLILGGGFLIPIVIAGLLASLTNAAIVKLEQVGLQTWLATLVAISAGLIILLLIGVIVQSQSGALAQAWPQYTQRTSSILADAAAWTGPQIAGRIDTALSNFDVGQLVTNFANKAGSVFSDIALILIYTGFLLAERGMLRAKLSLLVPNEADNRDLNEVVTSVSRGIRQYLSIKTMVSALTGTLTYAVLKIYGANFAELLGLFAFLLNFIPVIGSAIAVVIPVVLALMQFDTVGPALQIAALLAAVQACVGNVIEPKLMGRTLNLSPFVIMVALTFWTTIWGMVGAFLSVPIIASMVIICRNIQPLRWIAILLSADGKPDPTDKPAETSKFEISWPFQKTQAETQELKALRAELETMKQNKAKPAAKKTTLAGKPATKKRKPRTKRAVKNPRKKT